MAAVLIGLEWLLCIEGDVPPSAFTVYFAVAGIYALGFVHVTRDLAGSAFDRYRGSLVGISEADASALRDDLTHQPAGMTLVVSLGFVATSLVVLLAGAPVDEQMRTSGLSASQVSVVVNLILYVLNYAATGAAVHRIAHQSRQVARIYQLGRVDLFRPGPLHAFAWLTAASVTGMAVMFYAPVFLIPSVGGLAVWVVRAAVGLALAGLFLWPLWRVHQLLVRERSAALDRNLDEWRRFYDRFHTGLRAGEEQLPDLERNVVDTLDREAKTLRALSTWPWPAEVIPTVLGAIVLPLVLSLLLAFAQQWVGG
jgi:hypothetical protein